MQNKKVKIIYFSLRDSNSREVELTCGSFFTFIGACLGFMLVLVALTLAFFTDFYQDLEISSLTKVNKHLHKQLDEMGGKLARIEKRVADLESEDDHLRIVADLPKIDDDTRDVGVGGMLEVNYELPMVSDKIFDYQEVLDKMERRIELAKHSREEIKEKLEYNRSMMKHTPSIRPLEGGRISDKFGYRLHPIIDKIRRHPGIDISAERGTEVYATAAGVVEKVATVYKMNRGYGKYVLIDHGFGLKTLYGHLSKVMVRQGQTVDRWKPIGLVGDTGLATGPHLHYEVRKSGKQVDPLTHILD